MYYLPVVVIDANTLALPLSPTSKNKMIQHFVKFHFMENS